MNNLYTADEIAEVIRDCGFDVEMRPLHESREMRMNSRSSGVAWQAVLLGDDPFYSALCMRVPVWVRRDPYMWVNDWNHAHWTQASVATEPESNRPFRNGEYRLAAIEATLPFGTGVDTAYIAGFVTWWASELSDLKELPDVELFAELPL